MTKDLVLAILREENDYISGEKISKSLGISRAAVNMAVKSLRTEGYDIPSSTNKGYCLKSVPDSLTIKELTPYLGKERMKTVRYFDSVDSTNNKLRELALAGALDGEIIIANEQLQGRGRRGRTFLSPKDKGIYLSMLFHPDSIPSNIIEITAWTAVAVNNAIESVCGIRAGIKWVNDLILYNRKMCGILTEMSVESETGYVQYVLIGIGINVNETENDFPEELRNIASSLFAETGVKHSRAQLASAIIKELDKLRNAWPNEKQKYLGAYRNDNITTGRNISIVSNSEIKTATATAINDDFSLEVRYEDGHCESISSGEVSIHGLYEKIKLRAHHGMCLAFFEGKGYSDSFTKHMQSVLDKMQSNPKLQIIADGDIICSKCPNFKNGSCNTPELVECYDKQVLSLCGLKENSELSWNEFSTLIIDKILSKGKREDICSNCEWTEICKAKEPFFHC